jgi:rare lipoprotein A
MLRFGLASVLALFLLAIASLNDRSLAGNQCGKASWYKMGTHTASGEPMNPASLTGAHRTLPFGTQVRVENLANGRSVVVRINDRGPFAHGRVIDVTQGAAEALGFIRRGIADVRVTVVSGATALAGRC